MLLSRYTAYSALRAGLVFCCNGAAFETRHCRQVVSLVTARAFLRLGSTRALGATPSIAIGSPRPAVEAAIAAKRARHKRETARIVAARSRIGSRTFYSPGKGGLPVTWAAVDQLRGQPYNQ
jgi:hypothetical protein